MHFNQGITSVPESLQASDGVDQLVRSPLSQAPAPVSEVEGGNKPLMGIKKETQAVLTYIKQVTSTVSGFVHDTAEPSFENQFDAVERGDAQFCSCILPKLFRI